MSYTELLDEYQRLRELYLENPSDEVLNAWRDIENRIKEIEGKPFNTDFYDINLN